MKYLRAIISSDIRGVLYKKDFKVQNVFDTLARTFVSTLVTSGLIREGEFYNILIIPRYGQFRELAPSVTEHRSLREGEKRGWIALEFEDKVDPDQPISFFTVDLFVVEQLRSYRGNFQLKGINYFWLSIERALENLGVIRYKEQVQRNLYARDDEQGDFEHEEVQFPQTDTTALIELMPVQSPPLPFPLKYLADYNIQATKKLLHGKLIDDTPEHLRAGEESTQSAVQIVISASTLQELQKLARSGLRVEQGGVLVGNVYEDATTGERQYIVEITAHIPAERTFANEIELRYTFESWQHQTILLKERFPDKRIVGWYHTHLDLVKRTYYTDETRQHTYTTPLFFSLDDSFTHRQFFREKWYVAMVLDPTGNLTFYEWAGEEIVESRRFYVVPSEEEK